MFGKKGLKSAEIEESNMQKRDNVSFGGIIYGKLRKMFAEKDSAGVIETAYEVMNSKEYKASEEELRRIVMRKRGEGESVDISDNAKNDNADIHNANSNADAVVNSTDNNNGVINIDDNASDIEQAYNVNESIVFNKGDDEFNEGGEDITAQDNSGIDTDNGLKESNFVNIDDINAVSDAGNEVKVREDIGVVNEEGQNNVINGENDIANGDGIGYKGEEGNILNKNDIPKLTDATDYHNYVAEIAKRQDITKDEKVRHIQEAYKLTENKTDINCPIGAKYVEGFDNNGRIAYKWPKYLGFVKKSIISITRENPLPKIWDRIGSLKGSNFTTLSEDGQSYTSEERSVPYIKNPDAEHNGDFRTEHYFDIIDAIRNGDLETLNSIRQKQEKPKLDATDLIYYQEKYNQYIDWVKSEGIYIDATYGLQGYAAPWIIDGKIVLKGGAPQFTTPFTGEILKDLGLLEIKN